jgi:hypothetical protein
MPETLFAEIATPRPVPQMRRARSACTRRANQQQIRIENAHDTLNANSRASKQVRQLQSCTYLASFDLFACVDR